ncbi:MAG: hypothetical protein K2X27_10160 [Candidatus Obscuribacterales bacterium]|nr:hypothetical protein [Candidatus Obscuribacterales bacterium]
MTSSISLATNTKTLPGKEATSETQVLLPGIAIATLCLCFASIAAFAAARAVLSLGILTNSSVVSLSILASYPILFVLCALTLKAGLEKRLKMVLFCGSSAAFCQALTIFLAIFCNALGY